MDFLSRKARVDTAFGNYMERRGEILRVLFEDKKDREAVEGGDDAKLREALVNASRVLFGGLRNCCSSEETEMVKRGFDEFIELIWRFFTCPSEAIFNQALESSGVNGRIEAELKGYFNSWKKKGFPGNPDENI